MNFKKSGYPLTSLGAGWLLVTGYLILICIVINLYAEDKNLYEMFKNHPQIKIFLKEVINDTENPKIDVDIFKRIFKEVIENRKEVKFRYVKDEKEADVIIISRIKNFIFTENALPSFFSAAALTADVTSPKSSGKLVVDYEIKKPESEEVLLFYNNFTTDTRKPKDDMKGKMGFVNAVSKNIDRFIFRTFYKQGNK